jgi:hypothetical protein
MANKNVPAGFKVLRTENGGTIPLKTGLAALSTVITPGDALAVDSSGYLIVALSTSQIFGIAQSAVASNASVHSKVQFIPVTDGLVLEGQCSGTPTQALVGTNCDIEGTTGAQMVNEDATVTNSIHVIAFSQRLDQAIGQYARVQFKIKMNQQTGQA